MVRVQGVDQCGAAESYRAKGQQGQRRVAHRLEGQRRREGSADLIEQREAWLLPTLLLRRVPAGGEVESGMRGETREGGNQRKQDHEVGLSPSQAC